MSKIVNFANPPEPELSGQDTILLAWLQDAPEKELSTEMLNAMDEVDKDLFKGCF